MKTPSLTAQGWCLDTQLLAASEDLQLGQLESQEYMVQKGSKILHLASLQLNILDECGSLRKEVS